MNPREATQGGYTRVAFRVPNESDTASTTKVEVVLPEDGPDRVGVDDAGAGLDGGGGADASRPRRSRRTAAQVTEVVSKITWTAGPAAAIKPGEFQEFPVSLGPLPEVDRMVFKALQTYSDGAVVRWIEEPVDGGEEPEHPAPVLKLTKAGAAGTVPAGVQASGSATQNSDDDKSGGNGVAIALGVAGLIAGLGGAALGGLAYARTRRTS